jgi:hypothetical protein
MILYHGSKSGIQGEYASKQTMREHICDIVCKKEYR